MAFELFQMLFLRRCFRPIGIFCNQPALPDLGAPLQLLLEPGDIVLAHPKLAHRGAPNYSSNIRYMIYFRLKHVMHGTIDMQHNLILHFNTPQ